MIERIRDEAGAAGPCGGPAGVSRIAPCLRAGLIAMAALAAVAATTAASAQPAVPPASSAASGASASSASSAAKDAGAANDTDAGLGAWWRGTEARWNGWLQVDAAYAWPVSGRFTNLRTQGELRGQGNWGTGLKWRLSARAHYDAAYDLSDHYPPSVKRDQRAEIGLHEAYVDFSRGDWEFRLGKQNIVWGEMVGLFVADVVSAKDLRSFILPEFDQIRIPQWAARAEWFAGDSHLELIWVPFPEVDDIGQPGAEFFPTPLRYEGLGFDVIGEKKPSGKLSNSGVGLRASTLIAGWDLTAFVYRAPDTQPAFQRSLEPGAGGTPTVVYQARYDRVTRIGGTLSKDFDGIVAKAEVVHTDGRSFNQLELDAGNGIVELDTIDWAASIDATPADRWRINAQFYQRAFLDYDSRIGLDHRENGASLLVAHELAPNVDAEMLALTSLNRSDRLVRAMLTWMRGPNVRIRGGVDVFHGHPLGMFGRFADNDRVWVEYRYSF